MSTTTNLSINDGTTAQTFSPTKRDGGRLTFLNKVGAIASAFKAVALGFDLWNARRRTTKVYFDLDFPLPRTDSYGVVTATNVERWRVVGTIPDAATAAERLECYNLLKNGIALAEFQGYAVNDDPML
jgi:hypothetical protein